MGYIAPKIKNDGDKFDNHKPGEPGYEFSQIPNRLLSFVMRSIPGNSGNRLKLMIFLMGCGEKFEIHEKTVLKRTGMVQSAYSEARKWLNEVGFITYKPGTRNPTIKVNYAYIWALIHDEELEEYIEKVENPAPAPQESLDDDGFPSGSVVIGSQFWSWEKYHFLEDTEYFKSQGIDKKEIEAQLNHYFPTSRQR